MDRLLRADGGLTTTLHGPIETFSRIGNVAVTQDSIS